MKIVSRVLWIVVGVGFVAAAMGLIEWRIVLAPMLGVFIYQLGIASLGSLRRGADHIPDGPPEPVDPAEERTTYTCGGCGAEVLLLVRGAPTFPRHCGEKMHERREVPRGSSA